MPGFLSKIFSGPVTNVIDSVGGVLDKLTTSDAERLQAHKELAGIERQLTKDLLDADTEFAKSQAEVVIAEAKSDSWLAANWRPITMLTFVLIIVWNYIVVGTVGSFWPQVHTIPIPTDMWELLKLGIGGYIGARSVEKVAPAIVAAIQKTK